MEDSDAKPKVRVQITMEKLKKKKDKLMTQENLSEAIAEFVETHSNAQITIDETDGFIDGYIKKKSNIATYLAFSDRVMQGRQGPIKDLIQRHKDLLHETMVHIKGSEYQSTDEINFYEFKRVVRFLRVKQKKIKKVYKTLENEKCKVSKIAGKHPLSTAAAQESNLRREYKKYYDEDLDEAELNEEGYETEEEEDVSDGEVDEHLVQTLQKRNEKLKSEGAEQTLDIMSIVGEPYPDVAQGGILKNIKYLIQQMVLPLLKIISAIKLMLFTYKISRNINQGVVLKANEWPNNFTHNYSLTIHLKQIQNDFNEDKWRKYSWLQKFLRILGFTFLGFFLHALITIVVAFATILSKFLKGLGCICSRFKSCSLAIEKWSNNLQREQCGYSKQSQEGRAYKQSMVVLLMRDLPTLVLAGCIIYDVIECPLLKHKGPYDWLLFNSATALISLLLLTRNLYIRSCCFDEPMIKFVLVSMKAMSGFYPHQSKIKGYTLDHSIVYHNLEGRFWDFFGSLNQLFYQFSNETLRQLGNDLVIWSKQKSQFVQKYTVDISQSLDFVCIDEYLHFYDVIFLDHQQVEDPNKKDQSDENVGREKHLIYHTMPVKVEIDLSDEGISNMINNSIQDQIWHKDQFGKIRARTPKGKSLMKICIDSESVDDNQEWPLKYCMQELIEQGYDTTDYIDSQENQTLIEYAQMQNKKQSVEILKANVADQSDMKSVSNSVGYVSHSTYIKHDMNSKIMTRETIKKYQNARGFVVTLFLLMKELNSSIDFVSDFYILLVLLKSDHSAWFTLTLFTMVLAYQVCYVPLVNLVLNRDSLKFSETQSIFDKCLAIVMVTPLILIYLVSIDICFMISTLIGFVFFLVFEKLFCGKISFDFDGYIDKAFAMLFSMTLNDVEGFRALKSLSQLFFESIPQILLQFRILIWLQSNTESKLYQDINMNALLVSIGSGILHAAMEFTILYIESKASECSFLEYIMINMNGRFEWIPFLNKLVSVSNAAKYKNNTRQSVQSTQVEEYQIDMSEKEKVVDKADHGPNDIIDLENISHCVCGQVFGVRVKLYDSSLATMMQNFSIMQPMERVHTRYLIFFVQAIDAERVTLMKFFEFLVEAKNKVFLGLEGHYEKIKEILDIQPAGKKMLKSELTPQDKQHPMILMAEYDYCNVLETLVNKFGASTLVKNDKNQTLVDIAIEKKSFELIRSLIRIKDRDLCKQITEKLDSSQFELQMEVINGILKDEEAESYEYILDSSNSHFQKAIVQSLIKQPNPVIKTFFVMLDQKNRQAIMKEFIELCFEEKNYDLVALVLDQNLKNTQDVIESINNLMPLHLKEIKNKEALSKMVEHLEELRKDDKLKTKTIIDHFLSLHQLKSFNKDFHSSQLDHQESQNLKSLTNRILDLILPYTPKLYHLDNNDFDNKFIYSYESGSIPVKHAVKFPEVEGNIGYIHQLVVDHITGLLYLIGGIHMYNDIIQINPLSNFETKLLKPMIEGRDSQSVCIISQESIIVTGGQNRGLSVLKSCELYQIATDNWIKLPDLNEARCSHSSCVLKNDIVYVISGSPRGSGRLQYEFEKLELSKNDLKWEQISVSIGEYSQRRDAIAVQYNDDEILILGGEGPFFDKKVIYSLKYHPEQHEFGEWARSDIDNIRLCNSSPAFLCRKTNKILMWQGAGSIYSIDEDRNTECLVEDFEKVE